MNILYLHPSGAFGGAGKSLIELWNALPAPRPVARVITPRGTVVAAFEKAGMEVSSSIGLAQFNNTWYGHYRGIRWLILLREILLLPMSMWEIWRLRHRKFDIIHANEITLLPLAIFAKWVFSARLLVHVRTLYAGDMTPRRSLFFNSLLRLHADAVLAIDDTVARSLPDDLPLHVIRNGLGISDSEQTPSAHSRLRLGALSVLVKQKGLVELIEALRIVKQRGILVDCIIGGENIRAPRGLRGLIMAKLGVAGDLKTELLKMINDYGLADQVRLVGYIDDVPAFYAQIDVICFPSHLNAAGRPVFEGALFGKPSITSIINPPKDSIIHGETGFAIDGPDPAAIADAIEAYARDPEMTRLMGEHARAWAREYFSIEKSGLELVGLYKSMVQSDGEADYRRTPVREVKNRT